MRGETRNLQLRCTDGADTQARDRIQLLRTKGPPGAASACFNAAFVEVTWDTSAFKNSTADEWKPEKLFPYDLTVDRLVRAALHRALCETCVED
jgi:hypothetical protein